MGVCTYTKGYYRNHASVTSSVIAGMGGTIPLGSKNLTAAQAQDILNATPGQSGNVSWGTDNLLLNLAQQVLASELNVARGSTASSAVQSAITQANTAITVTTGGSSDPYLEFALEVKRVDARVFDRGLQLRERLPLAVPLRPLRFPLAREAERALLARQRRRTARLAAAGADGFAQVTPLEAESAARAGRRQDGGGHEQRPHQGDPQDEVRKSDHRRAHAGNIG